MEGWGCVETPEEWEDGQVLQAHWQSDNLSATLFVLARNVENFRSSYNEEVLKILKKLKFYDPIPTYQSCDCVYDGVLPTSSPVSFSSSTFQVTADESNQKDSEMDHK